MKYFDPFLVSLVCFWLIIFVSTGREEELVMTRHTRKIGKGEKFKADIVEAKEKRRKFMDKNKRPMNLVGKSGRNLVQTNSKLCKTFVGQRGEERWMLNREWRVIKLMADDLSDVDLPNPLVPTIQKLIRATRKLQGKGKQRRDAPFPQEVIPEVKGHKKWKVFPKIRRQKRSRSLNTKGEHSYHNLRNLSQEFVKPSEWSSGLEIRTFQSFTTNKALHLMEELNNRKFSKTSNSSKPKPEARKQENPSELKSKTSGTAQGTNEPIIVGGDGGVEFTIFQTNHESGTITFEIAVSKTTGSTLPFFKEGVAFKIQEKQRKTALMNRRSHYYIVILQKWLTPDDKQEMDEIAFLEAIMTAFEENVDANTVLYDFDMVMTFVWKKFSGKTGEYYRLTKIVYKSVKDVSSLCGDTRDYIAFRKRIKFSTQDETTASFVEDNSSFYHNLFAPELRFTFSEWFNSYRATLTGKSVPKFSIEEVCRDCKEGRIQFVKICWNPEVTEEKKYFTNVAILFPKEGGDPQFTVRDVNSPESPFKSYEIPVFSIMYTFQQTQDPNNIQQLQKTSTVHTELSPSSSNWISNFPYQCSESYPDYPYTIGRSAQPRDLKKFII